MIQKCVHDPLWKSLQRLAGTLNPPVIIFWGQVSQLNTPVSALSPLPHCYGPKVWFNSFGKELFLPRQFYDESKKMTLQLHMSQPALSSPLLFTIDTLTDFCISDFCTLVMYSHKPLFICWQPRPKTLAYIPISMYQDLRPGMQRSVWIFWISWWMKNI